MVTEYLALTVIVNLKLPLVDLLNINNNTDVWSFKEDYDLIRIKAKNNPVSAFTQSVRVGGARHRLISTYNWRIKCDDLSYCFFIQNASELIVFDIFVTPGGWWELVKNPIP